MAPDWFKKGTTREQLKKQLEEDWPIERTEAITPPETPRARLKAPKSDRPSAVKKWGERVALACGVVSLCGATFKSCGPAAEFTWHWVTTLASTDQLAIRDARLDQMEKKLNIYNDQIAALQKDNGDLQKRTGELERRLDMLTKPGTTVVGRRFP